MLLGETDRTASMRMASADWLRGDGYYCYKFLMRVREMGRITLL